MRKFFLSSLVLFALMLCIPAISSAATSFSALTTPGSGTVHIVGADLNAVRYIRISTNSGSLKYFRPGCGCGTNPATTSVTWNNGAIDIVDPALNGQLLLSLSATLVGSTVSYNFPDIWVNPELDTVVKTGPKQVTISGEGLAAVPYIVLETATGDRIYYNPTGAAPNRPGVTVQAWNNGSIVITDLGLAPGVTITSVQTLWSEPGPGEMVGATLPVQIYIPGSLTAASSSNPGELVVAGTALSSLDAIRVTSDCGSVDVPNPGTWTATQAILNEPSLGGCTVSSIAGIKFGEEQTTLGSLNIYVGVAIDVTSAQSSTGTLFIYGQSLDSVDQVRITTNLGVITRNKADFPYVDYGMIQIREYVAWENGATVSKIEALVAGNVVDTLSGLSIFVAPPNPVNDGLFYQTTSKCCNFQAPTNRTVYYNSTALISTTATAPSYSNFAASADGTKVVYISKATSSAIPNVVVQNANGTGTKTFALESTQSLANSFVWSPDKTKLVFRYARGSASCQSYCIATLNVASDNTISNLRELTTNNTDPCTINSCSGPDGYGISSFAADGQHIISTVFIRVLDTENSQVQYFSKVLVMDVNGAQDSYSILNLPSTQAQTARYQDGYLFYRDNNNNLIARAMDASGQLVVGATPSSVNINWTSFSGDYSLHNYGSGNIQVLTYDNSANVARIRTVVGTGVDRNITLANYSGNGVYFTADGKWLVYQCSATQPTRTNVCARHITTGYVTQLVTGPSNNPPNQSGSLFMSRWGNSSYTNN